MTERNFFNRVAHGKRDILQEFVGILEHNGIPYCIIGGLAVNAYAEPVISLDLDIIVAEKEIDRIQSIVPKDWKWQEDRFSINISTPHSDLRIQIQKDMRYQNFIARAARKHVLGYEFHVASMEDVLQGKIWAFVDTERRESKRLKDLSDIKRLIESHQELLDLLPNVISEKLKSL